MPPYLAVQFVRFAWRNDTSKRAKVLRVVSFPDVLDVTNLCTDKLQKAIRAHCRLLGKAEDEKAGTPPVSQPSASTSEPMETDTRESREGSERGGGKKGSRLEREVC